MIHVIADLDPFGRDRVVADAPHGLTLAEMFPDAAPDVEVFIERWDCRVTRDLWPRVKPKNGVTVYVVRPPQDDVLPVIGTLAAIAVGIVAPYALAAGLPGVFGAGGSLALFGAGGGLTLAGSIAGGVAGALTTFAFNVLVGPQNPFPELGSRDQFERLSGFTGQSNQVGAFTPIPVIYGEHRMFPVVPMTAMPYTEIVGDVQYLRWKGVLGYGPLEIGGVACGKGRGGTFANITHETALTGSPIKIGDTPIDEFEGVTFRIGDAEWGEGLAIYTDQVITTAVNGALPASQTEDRPRDEWVNDGASITRVTDTDAREISLDIVFPGGLFSIGKDNGTGGATAQFFVQFRRVGETPWKILGPWSTNVTTQNCWVADNDSGDFDTEGEGRLNFWSNERETLRGTVTWRVAEGQYEVRVTRRRTRTGLDEFAAVDATWAAMRTIRNRNAFDMPGIVEMDLRIRATDQVGGSLQNLSVVATSMLPTWDDGWTAPQATRNPAWAYADIFAGPASSRPVPYDEIDGAALKEWAAACTAAGIEYNAVIDSGGTVLERAREIASTGRAAWSYNDGLVSVVRDDTADTPLLTVSPRVAWDFTERFQFPQTPHALRVQFTDPDTWERTERIVYDDSYTGANATEFVTLETRGVTDSEQAWKEGRYHLAQLRLRPYQSSFKQDVRSLLYRRGDTLELSYDTIAVGLMAARVKEVTTNVGGQVTGVTLDEPMEMETGKTYQLRFQSIAAGTPVVRASTIPTVSAADLRTTALDTPLDDVAVGDHVIFGESTRVAEEVKVLSIEPQGDLTAKVTVVPSAPAIYTADTGPIPAWDAKISNPVDPIKLGPLPPRVTGIASDESALLRQASGFLQVRAVLDYELDGQREVTRVQARYRRVPPSGVPDEAAVWQYQDAASPGSPVALTSVVEGVTYQIQLRGWSDLAAKWSRWSDVQTHTVVGKSTPPADVDDWAIERQADGSHVLSVTYDTPPPDWQGLDVLVDGQRAAIVEGRQKTVTLRPFTLRTPRDYEITVRAVDTSGNTSAGLSKAYTRPAPPNVGGLVVEQTGGAMRFRWRLASDEPDIRGVVFRVNGGRDTAWNDAIPLHEGVVTVSPWETEQLRGGTWTVMARARDTVGNDSAESAVLMIQANSQIVDNVVEIFDRRADGWGGTKINCAVDGGDLLADAGTDAMWAVAERPLWGDDAEPMWSADPARLMFGGDGVAMYPGGDAAPLYNTTFPKMIYNSTLTPTARGRLHLAVDGTGSILLEYRRRYPSAMWSGNDDAAMYATDEAAMYGTVGAYQLWSTSAEVGTELVDVRASIKSGPVRGRLTALTITVDAPDVVERFNGAVIDAGGTALTLSRAFREVRNVSVTPLGSAAASGIVTAKSIAPGPTIRLFDAAGAGVSGTADIIVQGI